MGLITYRQGKFVEARRWLQASLALKQSNGDRWEIARTLNNLALVAAALGEFEGAIALNRSSLALKRAIGDQQGLAMSLSNLAHARSQT